MDIEESLKSKEEKFKDTQWDKMFVSKRVITSNAFLSLRTPTACQVYLIFLTKCQWKKMQGKAKRKNPYYLANQGEIQFTYIEANNKWGISAGKFLRAINQLVKAGLIDIAKSGFGLHKDVTLYSISERWQKFGTKDFVQIERPKRLEMLGFKKNNTYGVNSKSEEIQQLPVEVEQVL